MFPVSVDTGNSGVEMEVNVSVQGSLYGLFLNAIFLPVHLQIYQHHASHKMHLFTHGCLHYAQLGTSRGI